MFIHGVHTRRHPGRGARRLITTEEAGRHTSCSRAAQLVRLRRKKVAGTKIKRVERVSIQGTAASGSVVAFARLWVPRWRPKRRPTGLSGASRSPDLMTISTTLCKFCSPVLLGFGGRGALGSPQTMYRERTALGWPRVPCRGVVGGGILEIGPPPWSSLMLVHLCAGVRMGF